jgi:SH3-like domain-containing protein
MSVTFLVLLFALVATAPGLSRAEKVRTNANAKVYNHPGEQGKVVVKVKEGQAMTVIGKEGRWLKVRVKGRTGYIPRTKVDMPDDDEIVRNTRRRPFVDGRSTKRGFGSSEDSPEDRIGADAVGDDGDSDSGDDEPRDDEPRDDEEDKPDRESDDGDEVTDNRAKARVSGKATVYSEPDKSSDKAFTATPKDTLFVESTKGKWTEVSVEEGDIGWIQSSKLDIDEDDGGGEDRGARVIDVRARLGWTLVSQKLSSSGGSGNFPDQYSLGSSSFAVSLGASVVTPYKKSYVLGGELTYDLAVAVPGIAFDPDGADGTMFQSTTTGFKIHQVNLRGLAGYDFHRPSGLTAFARLGYRYQAFRVDNYDDVTKNQALLAQENIKGPMIGAAIVIPKVTPKVALKLSLDAMVFGGSVSQTRFLEDGQDPSAKLVTVGASFVYHWKPAYDINVGYDLNYASLAFGAAVDDSQRAHMGTGVSRRDVNHTVTAGVGKTF